MSQQERRVLVAMTGALAGVALIGALVVLGGLSGSDLNSAFGPLAAALAALVVLRFTPRRTPARSRAARTDED